MDEDRRAVSQSGADDFLAKPCREDELLEKMRVLLNIAYDYEEMSDAEGEPLGRPAALSAERLGQLPLELVEELRNATLNGNKKLLDKLILKVRETEDAGLARRSAGACRQVRIRCPDAIAGGSVPLIDGALTQCRSSDIMIVDDNPANLKLLEDMLVQRGHEVRSFPLGRLALAAAMKNPPDLILLDINMPEMNGYEVCERLKSNAELADIPVIFLSALNETEDKVKAFRSGAVDYISKPFQFEEVHARVETHLKLHDLQRALKLQNEHLEEAVAARTRELAEANERLTILDRSKNEFLNLISHEFRTPLNGLLGVSELILDGMPSTEENNELQEMFERSRRRILSILDDALLLTEIDVNGEQFRSAPVSLSAALSRAIESTTEFAESRRRHTHPAVGGSGPCRGRRGLAGKSVARAT